jgi:iron complex outermembrane receptor protein
MTGFGGNTMRDFTRSLLLTSGLCAALPVALGATAAHAQTAPVEAAPEAAADADAAPGEVIVTARGRREVLADVPISIAAFDSERIATRGINSVASVAQLTPGLQFDQGPSPADIRPSLRGIALIEGRSNVAIIVDGIDVTGVTLNTTIGGGGAQTAAPLLDLERIEVVKGPQSVYFGRSAFAGAIQFISRDPSFTPEGKVAFAIGDRGRGEATAHVSGPIIGDTLAAKLSATYRTFQGFYQNPDGGQDLGGYNTGGIGGALLLKTGPLRVKVQGNYLRQHDEPPAGYVAPRADVTPYGVNVITEESFDESQIGISSDHRYQGNLSDTYRGIVNAQLDLGGGFSLNALTGYSKVDADIEFDFDTKRANVPVGTALPGGLVNCLAATCVGIFDFHNELQQISQELRLSYDNGPLRALVGGYFFDENYSEIDYSRFVGARAGVTADRDSIPGRPASLETNTYSGFGSLEYDVTDALTLTGELRYNHEVIRAASATGFNLLFGTGSTDITFRGRTTFDSWLPRASVRFDLAPNVNIYASAARGTKPGGFNTGQILNELRPFQQEKIWTYEVGTKGSLFDRRVTFELAAYYSDWRDVQVTTICYGTASAFGPEASCPDATAVSLNYIINADKARVKGIDASLGATPVDGLTLGLNYAFTDSTFEDFLARDVFPAPASPTPRQFGGNRMPLIPRHSVSGMIRLEKPLGDTLTPFVELDGRYRSSRYSRFDNRVLIGEKAVFDAQVGIKGEDWTLLAFMDNIFNDLTPEFTRYYGNWNPSRTNGEYIAAPAKRAVGLRFNKDF